MHILPKQPYKLNQDGWKCGKQKDQAVCRYVQLCHREDTVHARNKQDNSKQENACGKCPETVVVSSKTDPHDRMMAAAIKAMEQTRQRQCRKCHSHCGHMIGTVSVMVSDHSCDCDQNTLSQNLDTEGPR